MSVVQVNRLKKVCMKLNKCIFSLVFLISFLAFSQEKYIKHTVAKGETISEIAKQYHLKINSIYDLNPKARKGINFKETLLIPNPSKAVSKASASIPSNDLQKTHAVLPKETIYGIAKQYGLTVADLYKENPTLEKTGLRKGGKIKIPVTQANTELVAQVTVATSTNPKEAATVVASNFSSVTSSVVREVLPNETKYAIAREYGISVSDIDAANPILVSEPLKIGQQLIIPTKEQQKLEQQIVVAATSKTAIASKPSDEVPVILNEKPLVFTVNAITKDVPETEIIREVLAKETKYAIAKEYGITVAELERQNPKIKSGLPVGYQLNIRTKKQIETKGGFVVRDVINNPNVDTNYDVKAFHGTDFLDQLVSTASENIGTRYRSGGTTKAGFDCSGLMCTTFGAYDIDLPRTSYEMSQYGTKINNEDAQKGDLIFFKTNGRGQVNHVGMVVEVIDGDIKFIHASSTGVIISSIKEKYYSKRVTQINRVL